MMLILYDMNWTNSKGPIPQPRNKYSAHLPCSRTLPEKSKSSSNPESYYKDLRITFGDLLMQELPYFCY